MSGEVTRRVQTARLLCCLIASIALTGCGHAPKSIDRDSLREKSKETIFITAESEVFAEFVLHGQVPSTARQQHCLYLSERLERAFPRDAQAEGGVRQNFAKLSQLANQLGGELIHLQQSDEQRSVEEVRRHLALLHSQLNQLKESL